MPKKPGNAPLIGSGALSRDLRERISAEERRFLPGLSLLGIFGGHTSRVADGPRGQRSIMMCHFGLTCGHVRLVLAHPRVHGRSQPYGRYQNRSSEPKRTSGSVRIAQSCDATVPDLHPSLARIAPSKRQMRAMASARGSLSLICTLSRLR